jgi:hypothetical protein
MGACRFKAVNMPERLVCLNLPKTWEAYRAIASEYKDGVCDGPVSRELREAKSTKGKNCSKMLI